ncbi:RICIN domain-containing protein [Streptomyces klenkii]|uniref:RICIN domain-containing protein n=1 Tax=Streptomyces klenkii TaxID=1420899 RepID=UPI0034251853
MTVKIIKASGADACPEGWWALYDDTDFNTRGGGWGRVLIGDQSLPDLKPLGFSDRASSLVNRTGGYAVFYENAEESGKGMSADSQPGKSLNVPPGEQVSDLSRAELSSGAKWYAGGTVLSDSWSDQISQVVVDAPAERVLAPGVYTVTNVGSGKVLDVADSSTANGANIHQWESNGTDTQKWRIGPAKVFRTEWYQPDTSEYSLTSVASGKLLDVSGANAQQWEITYRTNQHWCLSPLGDGVFIISSLISGKVLDVADGSTANGANIQQWEHNGTDAQKWRFTAL